MRRNDIGSAHVARTRLRRLMYAGAAALVVVLVGIPSPASAHVTVTPSTTAAGAHAVLQFSVGHGCENSPTTRITIQLPAQITSVAPTRTASWTIAKQTEVVSPPVLDAHGDQIVQRVASVTFSAEIPLPDGYREVFELAVTLPEAKGTRLVFPTIQTCERGEAAWTEVPQDGHDVGELELPAPSFVVSEPAGDAHHHASARNTQATAGGDGVLTFAALTLGVLGSVLGGAALVRQRHLT
uniref:YcnI family copper-binding membrane protein n=1 Tax=Herbidospora sakaeratensis TaxID=564415 RepID=UPI0007815CED|nr:YcnI family protein [Herbidospora sakaeratensis]